MAAAAGRVLSTVRELCSAARELCSTARELCSTAHELCSAAMLFAAFLVASASLARAQFSEKFDLVTPPALPAGWTSTRTNINTPLWVTSNASSDTAPNSAFITDPGTATDASLFSPPVLNTGGQLAFRHRFQLEASFDGGVLEIKIDGGAFQDILNAGGSFVQGGYTGAVGSGNAIGARPAWTGSQLASYLVTVVNLPTSSINHTVQFRWRRGTDTSVSGTGWFVDSISFPVFTDLSLSKLESLDPYRGGESFSYTLAVTNQGEEIATGVTVSDPLPTNLNFASVDSISQGTAAFNSGGAVVANFGTLLPGASANVVFRVGSSLTSEDPAVFTITSPPSIARDYTVRRLIFGAGSTFTGGSGPLKLINDATGTSSDGCQALVNSSELSGAIALIRKSGLCSVDLAVSRAEAAGAIAAVVINPNLDIENAPGSGLAITIPALVVNSFDGAVLSETLQGSPVAGTVGLLQSQILNTAYVQSGALETVSSNNFALQYTSFLNDRDGDTVPDVQDNCDEVENLDQLNTDGDAFGDLCDTCTDVDGDGRGNPNFLLNTCGADSCDLDASKIFPGVCGCGVSDVDADGDGKPLCQDGCPNDLAKTAPGVCGCGTAETDLNRNKIVDCLRTPELRFRLQQAKKLLAKVNPRLQTLAQKKLKASVGRLVSEFQALIVGGGIQVTDSSKNLQTLGKGAASSIRKALKASSSTFAKSRKAANSAIAKIIKILSA